MNESIHEYPLDFRVRELETHKATIDQWKIGVDQQNARVMEKLDSIQRWQVGLLGAGLVAIVVELIRLLAAKG